MKKHIITLITILTMVAAPALAGVWVAQSSYGPTCYLVKIPSYGYLIGTGVVTNSGTTFTGYLKATPNPIVISNTSSGYPSTQTPIDCSGTGSNQGYCAYDNAMGGNNTATRFNGTYYYASGYISPYIVQVTNLTVTSAQPIACW